MTSGPAVGTAKEVKSYHAHEVEFADKNKLKLAELASAESGKHNRFNMRSLSIIGMMGNHEGSDGNLAATVIQCGLGNCCAPMQPASS